MKKILLLLMASSLFIGCAIKGGTIKGCSAKGCGTKGCCVNKAVNNTEPSEPKEPIEPTEGAEGVTPEVPDVKIPEVKMNILDGEINSGSITLKTEDIIKDCKKECVTFTISSDEWCDCMHQCSQYFLKVFYRISLGDMNMKIYMEECSSYKDAN